MIDEPLAIYRHHGKNIFSKRPALTNFRSFDVEQLKAEDRAVTECVVKCYIDNVVFLAASLIDKNLFIQAVETVFKSGIEPIRSSEADCVVRYIERHKELLTEAFGAYCKKVDV